MAAVYAIDLIAIRDKKRKMDSSIVKGWNVHYQTLEEVEEQERLKKQKEREEQAKAAGETEESEDSDEVHLEDKKEAFNRKTGSYSGNYGKKPVKDAEKKHQIDAILSDKPDAYKSALSAIKSEFDKAADEIIAESR